MPATFTVLASGSSGNASLLQCDGFGVLLDFGLGPRLLARRLGLVGRSWKQVHAALLTHTHGDHWSETTLVQLGRRGIPLYCHPEHADWLGDASECFSTLRAAGLVRTYEDGDTVEMSPSLRCRPLPVAHDSGATFGFRFEGSPNLFGPGWALGYASDLGCWDEPLADALIDVDLIALEFNHDEQMQRQSGRPYPLIARVLGDRGHLSNRQAGALLRAALARSQHDCLRHVVALHLSRDCNRPALALAEARSALAEHGTSPGVHAAAADRPGPTLLIDPAGSTRVGRRVMSPGSECA